MVVVDSSGWIEFLTDGPKADAYARYLKDLARLLVLAEKLTEAFSFPLLRLGAKGLLTYKDAPQQLERALIAVANGGFWVPPALLSHFVDEILRSARGPRPVS